MAVCYLVGYFIYPSFGCIHLILHNFEICCDVTVFLIACCYICFWVKGITDCNCFIGRCDNWCFVQCFHLRIHCNLNCCCIGCSLAVCYLVGYFIYPSFGCIHLILHNFEICCDVAVFLIACCYIGFWVKGITDSQYFIRCRDGWCYV